MFRLCLCLCLLPFTILASEPPLPVLIVSDTGYTWMIQDAKGKPVIYEFSQVIVLGKSPTSPPVPPVSGFGLDAIIRKQVAELSPTGKMDLPGIIKGLNYTIEMIKANSFKTTGEVEAVAAALMTAEIKDKADWKVLGTATDEALVKLQKSGKIKTVTDYGQALAEIAKALQ